MKGNEKFPLAEQAEQWISIIPEKIFKLFLLYFFFIFLNRKFHSKSEQVKIDRCDSFGIAISSRES